MRDSYNDSFWSLMTSKVIAGELDGLSIEELPIGSKSTWKEWVTKYPQTKVLSVNGREDAPFGYARYFSSNGGFRGLEASDNRLATKEQIRDIQPFSIPIWRTIDFSIQKVSYQ